MEPAQVGMRKYFVKNRLNPLPPPRKSISAPIFVHFLSFCFHHSAFIICFHHFAFISLLGAQNLIFLDKSHVQIIFLGPSRGCTNFGPLFFSSLFSCFFVFFHCSSIFSFDICSCFLIFSELFFFQFVFCSSPYSIRTGVTTLGASNSDATEGTLVRTEKWNVREKT